MNSLDSVKQAKIFSNLTLRDKVFFISKIVIAISLLIYVVDKFESINFSKIFFGIDYFILSIVIILAFFNVYIQYIKWKLLCRICLNENNSRTIALSLFYGFAAAAFTPAKIGEYFGRDLAFKNHSLLEVSIVTVVDKLFNLFLILFIGAISVILFLHYKLQLTFLITLSLFLLLFVMFFIAAYILVNENTWQNYFIQSLSRFKFIKKLGKQIRFLQKLDKKTLTLLALYSLLFYSCFIIQYALLVSSFSVELSFLTQLWAGALTFFVKTLIPAISIGELGVREAASVYFLSSFGLSEQIGFNSAFILFLVNVLLPAVIGMLLLFKKNNQ